MSTNTCNQAEHSKVNQPHIEVTLPLKGSYWDFGKLSVNEPFHKRCHHLALLLTHNTDTNPVPQITSYLLPSDSVHLRGFYFVKTFSM